MEPIDPSSKERDINSKVLAELENMIMPDLTNYELMDIIPLLENVGCNVLVEGNGKKIRQSVKPGSKISKGQLIKIKLI